MLLKQRLDFPVVEKIQAMDRLAIIQFQNIVETTVGFSGKEKKETMDSLAIIQGQKKLLKRRLDFPVEEKI